MASTSPLPEAKVLWWDSTDCTVLCPHCDKGHRHFLTPTPTDSKNKILEYNQTSTRIARCQLKTPTDINSINLLKSHADLFSPSSAVPEPKKGYVLKFPFPGGYEILKDRGRYTSSSYLASKKEGEGEVGFDRSYTEFVQFFKNDGDSEQCAEALVREGRMKNARIEFEGARLALKSLDNDGSWKTNGKVGWDLRMEGEKAVRLEALLGVGVSMIANGDFIYDQGRLVDELKLYCVKALLAVSEKAENEVIEVLRKGAATLRKVIAELECSQPPTEKPAAAKLDVDALTNGLRSFSLEPSDEPSSLHLAFQETDIKSQLSTLYNTERISGKTVGCLQLPSSFEKASYFTKSGMRGLSTPEDNLVNTAFAISLDVDCLFEEHSIDRQNSGFETGQWALGQYYASHVEPKCVAQFVERFVFLPTDRDLSLISGIADEPGKAERRRFYELAMVEPPLEHRMTKAKIWVSRNPCDSCAGFIAAVNKELGLNIEAEWVPCAHTDSPNVSPSKEFKSWKAVPADAWPAGSDDEVVIEEVTTASVTTVVDKGEGVEVTVTEVSSTSTVTIENCHTTANGAVDESRRRSSGAPSPSPAPVSIAPIPLSLRKFNIAVDEDRTRSSGAPSPSPAPASTGTLPFKVTKNIAAVNENAVKTNGTIQPVSTFAPIPPLPPLKASASNGSAPTAALPAATGDSGAKKADPYHIQPLPRLAASAVTDTIVYTASIDQVPQNIANAAKASASKEAASKPSSAQSPKSDDMKTANLANGPIDVANMMASLGISDSNATAEKFKQNFGDASSSTTTTNAQPSSSSLPSKPSSGLLNLPASTASTNADPKPASDAKPLFDFGKLNFDSPASQRFVEALKANPLPTTLFGQALAAPGPFFKYGRTKEQDEKWRSDCGHPTASKEAGEKLPFKYGQTKEEDAEFRKRAGIPTAEEEAEKAKLGKPAGLNLFGGAKPAEGEKKSPWASTTTGANPFGKAKEKISDGSPWVPMTFTTGPNPFAAPAAAPRESKASTAPNLDPFLPASTSTAENKTMTATNVNPFGPAPSKSSESVGTPKEPSARISAFGFGATTTAPPLTSQGGLFNFGPPAFGQTSGSTTISTFGQASTSTPTPAPAFGQSPSTSTPAFGNPPTFGQTTTSSAGTASSVLPATFGSTQTSEPARAGLFGLTAAAPNPAPAFGVSTSLFTFGKTAEEKKKEDSKGTAPSFSLGSTATSEPTKTGLFGSTNTATNPSPAFGASASLFGFGKPAIPANGKEKDRGGGNEKGTDKIATPPKAGFTPPPPPSVIPPKYNYFGAKSAQVNEAKKRTDEANEKIKENLAIIDANLASVREMQASEKIKESLLIIEANLDSGRQSQVTQAKSAEEENERKIRECIAAIEANLASVREMQAVSDALRGQGKAGEMGTGGSEEVLVDEVRAVTEASRKQRGGDEKVLGSLRDEGKGKEEEKGSTGDDLDVLTSGMGGMGLNEKKQDSVVAGKDVTAKGNAPSIPSTTTPAPKLTAPIIPLPPLKSTPAPPAPPPPAPTSTSVPPISTLPPPSTLPARASSPSPSSPKSDRSYCSDCGSPGHHNCGYYSEYESDDFRDDEELARRSEERENEKEEEEEPEDCQVCFSQIHTTNEHEFSDSDGFEEGEDEICEKCDERGHTADECTTFGPPTARATTRTPAPKPATAAPSYGYGGSITPSSSSAVVRAPSPPSRLSTATVRSPGPALFAQYGDTCYRCNERGHWAADCPGTFSPSPPSRSQSQSLVSPSSSVRSPSQSLMDQYGDQCYKCRERGHWAADCPGVQASIGFAPYTPASPSPSPVRSVVRSPGRELMNRYGDDCYKCGERGHWASDCPESGGGRYGSGYGSSSYSSPSRSGNCYSCGGAGHWSSECPNRGYRY